MTTVQCGAAIQACSAVGHCGVGKTADSTACQYNWRNNLMLLVIIRSILLDSTTGCTTGSTCTTRCTAWQYNQQYRWRVQHVAPNRCTHTLVVQMVVQLGSDNRLGILNSATSIEQCQGPQPCSLESQQTLGDRPASLDVQTRITKQTKSMPYM